ncbi:aminomethyl-transferring glycine dehydrogenase subunit GcvPA [Lutibaculum baratangense]|uniref:Probable glycine dehydrogenase (decarboxylating) subunit 1 n=1 Tax=Lutibaculum baratangense AMV1 TaxID=631454 RepID=V4R2P5_9HYPH|nr:aminomethyl-transferring glycine dehydrogenase subunit GcvPA [Lutibaculum baratangense]ESR26227.1 Glycine dehydrogenase [decarboxylating] (glycine cleavage system P1 protein) [Lutibaculum baratangense AMV1]
MRYLPLSADDRAAMLHRIGVGSIDDLFADVPRAAWLDGPVDLPAAKSEIEVERRFRRFARRNLAAGDAAFFCGAGAYRHHVPATVDHLIQRSEFLTSYTPYQPEISQGTLQVLFEFQTQVCELTGMEVANASMYDGSTATAEAVLMAHRLTKRSRAVVAGNLHPHYAAVVETTSRLSSHDTVFLTPTPEGGEDLLSAIDGTCSCVVVQTPDVFGHPVDLKPIAERAHEAGALLVAVVTEAVSLGLMVPPGAQGADIVVAEGQSLGNGLNFGGPYVGLFATRQKFLRQMPGRVCGETVDVEGKRGYVLTLSTREQHIRREKATSNICTNSGLCALAFTVHLTLLGGVGLERLARLNHARATRLADALAEVPGVEVLNKAFFNEFTVRLPKPAAEIAEALAGKGVLGGVPMSRLRPGEGLDDLLVVAATETNTDEDIDVFASCLKEVLA